jgi:hypothetical protein
LQTDVNIGDRFSYDGVFCLELYKGYLAGTETMDDFLRYLKRHVVIRVRKRYLRRVRRDLCEDLIQAALIELWQIAQKRQLPSGSVPVFHKFANTVIHRKIAKTFTELYDDAPKKMDPSLYIEEFYRKIPGLDDAESRVFLEELSDTIKGRVRKTLRVNDTRFVAAVEHVMEQMLDFPEEEPGPEAFLKRRWKIEDPKFLIEHVSILIKAELYKIREDLKFRTNSEKREVLHEGLEEFFDSAG